MGKVFGDNADWNGECDSIKVISLFPFGLGDKDNALRKVEGGKSLNIDVCLGMETTMNGIKW